MIAGDPVGILENVSHQVKAQSSQNQDETDQVRSAGPYPEHILAEEQKPLFDVMNFNLNITDYSIAIFIFRNLKMPKNWMRMLYNRLYQIFFNKLTFLNSVVLVLDEMKSIGRNRSSFIVEWYIFLLFENSEFGSH